MMLRVLVLLLWAFGAHASSFVVHTNGDPHSRVLAKMFFPDAPVLASPGADGLLVWKRLDENKTDVVIQLALAVHYQPFLPGREDYATTHDLLATLATTRQLLMVKADSPIQTVADAKLLGRPAVVGWNSHACEALVRSLFEKNGVEMTYISYKTSPEAVAALLGGHTDFACPAASTMQQLLNNKTGRAVLDITAHHGFMLTTQIFVNKDMPVERRNALIKLITRPLTAEDHTIAQNNGFELTINTGEAAMRVFKRDRTAWRKVLGVK